MESNQWMILQEETALKIQNKMKPTALESYIEWLKHNIKIAEEYQLNNLKLLNVCLENAEKFLPMEKEQMQEAYQKGFSDFIHNNV